MIRIEVKSPAVSLRQGVAKRTGKPYEFHEQRAWLHGSKEYPTEVAFIVPRDDQGRPKAFAPGFYFVGPECAEVDRFGNITLRLERMKPIPKAQGAAA